MIDGKQVGHIKREYNETLVDCLNNGGELKARFEKLVGTSETNYGIVITVSTYEKKSAQKIIRIWENL